MSIYIRMQCIVESLKGLIFRNGGSICLFQISNGLPHTDVYVDIFQSVDSLILLRMSFQEGVRFVLDLFMRYPDGTAPPKKEGNIKIMDYFFDYVGKVWSQSLVEISKKTNTTSVWKYLSSKWIKGNVSRRILVLDTSLFIHFDDQYFRTEGVEKELVMMVCVPSCNIGRRIYI